MIFKKKIQRSKNNQWSFNLKINMYCFKIFPFAFYWFFFSFFRNEMELYWIIKTFFFLYYQNVLFLVLSDCSLFAYKIYSMFLGIWKYFFLFQLQPNSASGSGALEHDAASLYSRAQPVNCLNYWWWQNTPILFGGGGGNSKHYLFQLFLNIDIKNVIISLIRLCLFWWSRPMILKLSDMTDRHFFFFLNVSHPFNILW